MTVTANMLSRSEAGIAVFYQKEEEVFRSHKT